MTPAPSRRPPEPPEDRLELGKPIYDNSAALGVHPQGTTPVPGGRGTLSGACADTGIFFLTIHGDWRL
jgi:hypothetical protein